MRIVDSKKTVYLALDTAYQQGVVVLIHEGNMVFEAVMDEKYSHGKWICQAFDEAGSYCKKNYGELAGIFCGLGPGSFVGVRVALATALGFSFARHMPLMGFCSHQALGLSHDHSEESFKIFMKASGDLGYLTSFRAIHERLLIDGPTEVISIDRLADKIRPREIIFSDMADRLVDFLEPQVSIKKILGPSPSGVFKAVTERLHEQGSLCDESRWIKPNYIKPANVTLPAQSR